MSINITELPFYSSVPLVVVGQETAILQGGGYTFSGKRQNMTPPRSLLNNALYIVSAVSFTTDISILDFQSSINTNPAVNFFSSGQGGAPLGRDKIVCANYLEQFQYMYLFEPASTPNFLKFNITGELEQTPNLVGKNSLTATVTLSMMEVTNEKFRAYYRDYLETHSPAEKGQGVPMGHFKQYVNQHGFCPKGRG
jgi:hypothetical protein